MFGFLPGSPDKDVDEMGRKGSGSQSFTRILGEKSAALEVQFRRVAVWVDAIEMQTAVFALNSAMGPKSGQGARDSAQR
ncbi:hypothetical protein MUK42_36240 [Musa troglodytarum]|uniref:Uncharacterized protein n=1 Tax=Musa troglodytarum TaxID=320322 RepID=A0A9E7KUL9_9LILI|nr:hypothetical protein MUK42_36240 [Musa troglodytarum]